MSQAHADCPHCRQDGSEAKHIALKEVRIALAGNPNCGKTTAFNEYTGTHQHVGNYPGVTVDKKEGYVSIDGVEVLMVDLPGTYSLTAYSQEEIVTRAVLAPEKAEEKPMAVVDLVDTSALERNLFLTVQIMEMGLPVVLACNMMDEARKAGIQVDTKELGKQLGIPVVATVARSGEGLKDALREAIAFGRRGSAPLNISYGPDLDPVLTKMERLLAEKGLLTDRYPARWIALKVLENDSEILRQVERMPDVAAQLRADRETVADHLRDTLQTSPEAIIADYRYGFIRGVLRSGAVRRESAKDRLELSDKLDKVLTNTLFGPLIMLGVLYAMFQLTFVIGAYPQGWVEDGFGWLGETVSALMPDGFLKSLIVSGVIDGLGGVMSFVPLIIIMFTLVAILEDFGYMARMAYMLDRVFRAFGLHGASVHQRGRYRGRLCHPRRHGHPDLAQSQGKAGDPAHASLYGVRSQTPRVPAAGGRVLPRKPRPYHVPADVGRLGRRASHGAPHALDHHPRRIHPVRHGIAPVPRPHPAQRGHALLGTHMDVSQKGRDRACCRVHPDLGEHDLPDAGS